MAHPTKKLLIAITAVLSLSLFLATSSQAAEYTIIPLPNSYGAYYYSQINNGQVIWQGSDGNNWQIFFYDGKQTIQLSSGYFNFEPQIDNGQVTWTYWDGDTWNDDNVQIFLYDGKQTIQLTNSFNNDSPQIDNGQVVWQGRLRKYDKSQIFFYDGKQTIRLTNDNYAKREHQIDNGRVVWSGSDGPNYQILLYDGIKTTQIFSNSIWYNDSLQMRNGQIVWRSPDNNGWQIFLYDGRQTIQLTNDSYDKTEPQLNNGKVVWSSYDGNNYEIFLYDGKQTTQLTNNDYDNNDFQIDNGQVVWQSYDGSHYQIFLYDGAKTIQLTNGSYDNYAPQINNGQIAWLGYDGNSGQIFLYDGRQTIRLTNRGPVKKTDFLKLNVDINALFKNLIKNGYIDANGIIQNKFYSLEGYSGMSLDPIYESQKEQIYTILRQYGDIYDNYAPQINNGQIVWYGYDRGNAISQIWLAKPQQEQLLEILDGADFTAGRTVTTDTNKLARQEGTVMEGAVTDGVTRLLLRMEAGDTNPVTFALEGEGSNPETDNGFLQAIENQDSARKNQSLTVTPVSTDNKNYVFAVYRAPENFVRQNNTGDLRISERTITIKAQANNQTIAAEDIKLVRPPVILVHGLWAGPDMWWKDGFAFALASEWPGIWIFRVDYGSTNDEEFDVNKNKIKDMIEKVRKQYRSEEYSPKRIAMVQADVVGHSMGGLLARIWVGAGEDIYERKNNFYEGDINKLITLDSPHYGSFLADAAINCLRGQHSIIADSIFWGAEKTGHSLTKGAVEDLMTTSQPIVQMNAKKITTPVHSIAGEYIGASLVYYTEPDGTVKFVIEGLPSDYFDLHNLLIDEGYGNIIISPVIYAGTDLVVSVYSQKGNLDLSSTDTFNHHHIAATTQDVANRVIELLNADTDSNLFNSGFPVSE